MASGKMGSEELVHFSSVAVAEDHHFKSKPKNTNNVKIMREWRILQGNLPDSIYVQVYETRIELLRAVIIGSPRTPYHDGLFFFDIYLPPGYPNFPPQVYYHSHGYRLNPNLYANGMVCLSLINTWHGSKEEKWTNGSTILQLLVSIQGLVLNSRPYFNEPGWKLWKDSKLSMWIKSSNRYNEDAFILTCKTMEKVMRHPPQHFKEFVVEHFRQRAAPLIAAIDGYHQGLVPVGQLGMTATSSSCHALGISSTFKSNLEWIRGHLESAFASESIPVPSKPRALSRVSSKPRAPPPPSTDKSENKDKQHKKGLLNSITSFLVKKIWKKEVKISGVVKQC